MFISVQQFAIRELVEAYAHCADRRDAEGQMSLFTLDTHFVVFMNAKDPKPAMDLHSREALAPVFADLNKYDATTHFVGQSTIFTLMSDRAIGEGVSRLDSYFDPNERKYYITPESVEMAIAEEKAKAAKVNEPSEPVGSVRNDAERTKDVSEPDTNRVKELERENLDLKITNRGKDFLIDQIQKERKSFFDQLLTANRKMGELETKLLQIEPRNSDGH